MRDLRGKTRFITGASRGIALAIALRATRDGANVVIAAKNVEEEAEAFRTQGTVFNTLSPRTAIATEAIRDVVGNKKMIRASRAPEIVVPDFMPPPLGVQI